MIGLSRSGPTKLFFLALSLSALAGCFQEPNALARIDEVLPEGTLTAADRAELDRDGVVVLLGLNEAHVTVVGDFEFLLSYTDEMDFLDGLQERRSMRPQLEPMLATTWIPIADGRFPAEDLRGNMLRRMYEALREKVDVHQDFGHLSGDPDCEFKGEITIVVHREVPFSTLIQVFFTAGQAQFGNLTLITYGASKGPPVAPTENAWSLDPLSREDLLGQRSGAPVSGGGLRSLNGKTPPEGRFTVDDSAATFTIRAGDNEDGQLIHGGIAPADSPVGTIFPDPGNPYLYPSFTAAAASAKNPVLPSLEMLLHLSKQADDALIGAIERDRSPSREEWLSDAVAALDVNNDPEAVAWLTTAALLGKLDVNSWNLSAETTDKAKAQAAEFLADPKLSAPLGIYSADDELGAIFRRDRWLLKQMTTQRPEDLAVAGSLKELLESHPALRSDHDRAKALQGVLTNAPSGASLLDVDPDKLPRYFHFMAPAGGPETDLMDELGGTANVAGATMALVVQGVRSGEVQLRPEADSGWYDHQLWALEPLLLLPHKDKIEPNAGYIKRLEDAFKAAFAMRRESHVKSLHLPAIGAPPPPPIVVDVAPDFRVEPVPTHYQRSADAYRFLEDKVLNPHFGTRWRDWEEGALAAGIALAEDRYRSAAAISRADLGLAYGATDWSVEETDTWLRDWRDDPAMNEDLRFMIPFGEDNNGTTIAWTVMGVKTIDIEVEYVVPPQITLSEPGQEVVVNTHPRSYTLLMPVFQETMVANILSREEFRALADTHRYQADLMQALR